MVKEAALERLLVHAKKNNCEISDDLEFRIDPVTGVGAYLKHKLHNKEALIKISQDFILTKAEALQYFEIDSCSSSNPNAITQLYLIALQSNQSAKWQPYLDVLPSLDDISSPLVWQPHELEIIRGSDLYIKTKRKLASLLDEWYEILTELNLCSEKAKKYYELQDRDNIAVEKCYSVDSFAAYLWAHLIFSSRAFPSIIYDNSAGLEEGFLLPIVDLLNHKSDTKVHWKSEGSFITFSSEEIIEAKGELYNNYGDKSNEELLLGYGFAIDSNPHDATSISLKLDEKTLSEASNYGTEINPNNVSGDSVRFDISLKDPLPVPLIKLFGFISKLKSEKNITVRAVLEGLDQLYALLHQKIAIFKAKTKFESHNIRNESIIKNAKIYLTGQRRLFHSSQEELQREMKAIMKIYKPVSFKSIYKLDPEFSSSLSSCLNVSSYEELVKKGLAQHALLLWIVKAHNAKFYKSPHWPSFVSDTFNDVERNITIEKDDVLEYMQFYQAFFPNLSQMFPKVYSVGSWSIKDFIIAGVVMDRIVWLRMASNEYFLFEKQTFDFKRSYS